jgi:predicted RNA-binding protein with RPS1 domain
MDNPTATAIQPKEKLTGKVIKTTLAGAVVDIGKDKPGVVHISKLQEKPVVKVDDVVKAGDEVTVWIRRERKDADYYDLTMVEPLPLEWNEIKNGMVLKGKVVKIERFGAFVDIGTERPGLVHISELTHDYIRNTDEAVTMNEEVEVKVLGVDRRKKQIKLSMKALQEDPKKFVQQELEEEKREPALTAMEIAWKRALDEENDADPRASASGKKDRSAQEEIFERTLKNRRE